MSIDQQTNPPNPYDETYYRVGCGVPYERSEHWLAFFGKMADAIVREINPASVLDAGCAMGFLVEALRQRGVEAYGVDISEYAIAQVADEIKPYCWVGSLTEPLPRRYDLVVTIETLEHLHASDIPSAIQNLCAATDDILFSSTPDDRSEPTHFSVQPPEVWASLFAARGFWHDVEFDPTFVTPWAMRYRQTGDPAHRALIPLERALWSLRRENSSLRDLANSMRDLPETPANDELEQRVAQFEDALRTQQQQQADVSWQLLSQAFDTANTASHADELRKEVIALTFENQRLRTELTATSKQLSQLLFHQTALQSRAAYKVFTRTVRSIDALLPEGSVRSR
ncbi:MAG TPA: class I SAM-dependent methyltransferase, partial [Ktedonobacterales bacterium]